jgi:hypothetical protein
MPGVRLLDCVHRQRPDGIDAQLVDLVSAVDTSDCGSGNA